MAEDDDNLSGNSAIQAESIIKQVVPAKPDKTESEKAWEEKLIAEAQTRIERRTYLFWGVLGALALLFMMFISYIILAHLCSFPVDHLLLWLLGALPLGLVFVLIKLTSDPKKDEPITTWPEELIKLGNNAIDVIADIAKKKLG